MYGEKCGYKLVEPRPGHVDHSTSFTSSILTTTLRYNHVCQTPKASLFLQRAGSPEVISPLF
jgi:hypothetical protein